MAQRIDTGAALFLCEELKDLLFRIFASDSALASLVRLPSDQPSTQLEKTCRFLLRISGILDGLYTTYPDTPNPARWMLDRPTTLRFLFLVLRTSSIEPTNAKFPYNETWRHVALDAIVAATRMLFVSHRGAVIDEEDGIRNMLQQVAHSWRRFAPASSTESQVEEYILERIIPSVFADYSHQRPRLQRPWEEEVMDTVSAIISQPNLLPDKFWHLHDLISEAFQIEEISLVGRISHKGENTSVSASNILRVACERARGHNVDINAKATVLFQMRRLASTFALYEQEGLRDANTLNRTDRILISQEVEFRGWFNSWRQAVLRGMAHTGNAPVPERPRYGDRRSSLATTTNDSIAESSISATSEQRSTLNRTASRADSRTEQLAHRQEPSSPRDSVLEYNTKFRKPSPIIIENGNNAPTLVSEPALGGDDDDLYSSPQPSHTQMGSESGISGSSTELSTSTPGWDPSHQLPVSTGIPGMHSIHRHMNTLPERLRTDPNPSYEPPPTSSPAAIPPPGLEIWHQPATPPSTLPRNTEESNQAGPPEDSDRRISSHSQTSSTHPRVHHLNDLPTELDVRPHRSLSSASRIMSLKKGRFSKTLAMFTSSPKEPMKQALKAPPSDLQFCFSRCATYIIFWFKKNPLILVRATLVDRSWTSIPINTAIQLEAEKKEPGSFSLRHVACSGGIIVAVVYGKQSCWLYMVRKVDDGSEVLEPLIAIEEYNLRVLDLSVSRDGKMIALACGNTIRVYHLNLQGTSVDSDCAIGYTSEQVGKGNAKGAIRAHKVNFNPDSTRLLSAVQIDDNSGDHDVHIAMWKCAPRLELYSRLSSVKLTLVDGNDSGISSVHSFGVSDSAYLQNVFLTAAIAAPYQSFPSTGYGRRNRYLSIEDTCIINCAQSFASGKSSFFVVRSGPDKIVRVDARSGTGETLAKIATECKGLDLRHECVALGMPSPETIYVLTRTKTHGIRLRTYSLSNGLWTARVDELGDMLCQYMS